MAKKKKSDKPSGEKPTPKKRGRGRPKKRGRKKKYYKPKKKKTGAKAAKKVTSTANKGFASNVSYNRVRSALWREYKDDFASYRDFISNDKDEDGNPILGTSLVSKVYAQCKDLDCSDDDIISIYRQFKTQDKDGDMPLIPDSYFEASNNYYWTLISENIYDGLDERLWIVSPMLLNDPPYFLAVLGEDRCIDKATNKIASITKCREDGYKFVQGKKYRFQPFVDYCNQMASLDGFDLDSFNAPHWRMRGLEGNESEPYWNELEMRWEVELVPCMDDGTIEDYGFDPTSLAPELPDDFVIPTSTDKPKPTPEDEPTPPSDELPKDKPDFVEQAKIKEIEQTGKLERLEKKKAGILNEILTYDKLGKRGEALIDKALARLDKINDEIDKIQ